MAGLLVNGNKVEYVIFKDTPDLRDIEAALWYLGLTLELERRVWKSRDGHALTPCTAVIIKPLPIPQESADEHAESCGI